MASLSIHRVRALPLALVLAALLAVLALAQPARASVGVGSNAATPVLRVDAKGNAEVTYTSGGRRQSVLVPVKGAIEYGGKLPGADISRGAKKPALPYMRVIRRAGEWLYALQTWPTRTGPVELRFSRWQGAPTKLTLKARRERRGIALSGRVTYAGKAIPIVSRTPGGTTLREYVYLDHRLGKKWSILGGVAVKRDGSYRRLVSHDSSVRRFRASVAGPNFGTIYAPDMVTHIPPP